MILLLGGTAEARELAARTPVLSSLAGRVSNPRLPEGEVRIGGFGGVDGLASFLSSEGVKAVVDATHPFAAGISANAAAACARVGVPLLRLERPGWSDLAQAGRWHWVDNHEDAAWLAADLGERVFLSTGRQSLPVFEKVLPVVVARVVEPAVDDALLPEGWLLLLDRGPYTLEGELALLRQHQIDVVVTKDSGGDYTRPKLDAADELGIEVIVVRRPPPPAGVDVVSSVDAAVDWLAAR
ncbi:MAG TPA: cobalt-precorrin-6A reductase [Nocardioidaceae bacterium]|nr:cobalt-precorrin-6A reductase [Nocardioidaceae bacterium]